MDISTLTTPPRPTPPWPPIPIPIRFVVIEIIAFILCEIIFGEYVFFNGILNENYKCKFEFENENVKCKNNFGDIFNGYYATQYPTPILNVKVFNDFKSDSCTCNWFSTSVLAYNKFTSWAINCRCVAYILIF